MQISVVIPVYNEEESAELLCRRLHEALSGLGRTYEIILVDDGSSDRTWEVLTRMAGEVPGLELIRFRRNYGQTAAMSAGFHAARGEVVITLDADLQNDPADIPKLLERIDQGYDVVSGWRKDRKDAFINRRLPSMLANGLISKITGVELHDYGCTLKAYRHEVVKNIHLYGEMHRFIPALASWVGGSIDEVVVQHHARKFGRSKYGISRTFRVVLDLLTVKFLLHYSTRPIHIFGKLGGVFAIPGFLMLAVMILAHLSFLVFGTDLGADLIKRPFWIMTSFALILFSLQFISMGLLAEMQIRTYHESQAKPIYLIRERRASTAPTR
ncbi:MAG TPA: glycosyltransferase family 2 protein [Kiritimatiellia bacterium]|nr:glycosyltransferase family 2 protein [Kiritimatiellia bacterium]HMO98934.1 glycosyltransferase family 2 protein [Kiritimatiellia bacterium]HMP95733.1 glycosyltransferase family 2 protein [Kiritimatiellia bacterium]